MSNIQDFLEKTNFVIRYDYDEDLHVGKLTSSFDSNIDFSFKYENGQLISEIETIACPPYIVNSLIEQTVRDICETLKYPYDYVIKSFNQNKTYYLRYPVPDTTEDQIDTVSSIIEELQTVGLTPPIIDLVRENKIEEGFKVIFERLYDARIDL